MEKKFDKLKIPDQTDINILLLGETGVGKSTFINSIANYLQYHALEKAMKQNLFYLIPCMFNITDEAYQMHRVVVGSDANELQLRMFEKSNKNREDVGFWGFLQSFLGAVKVGQALPQNSRVGDSATQDVKTYVFPIGNGSTRLRLIDTPGMGDPRGVEQDDINCDNILSYIGKLNYLHAICFLFKPNDARITVMFEYCIKQILSRLEKSAAKNIIFIFTNSKATQYKPGETIACLKKMVEDIRNQPPNVEIKIQNNVFCFDNEAFRYLAAVKQGIIFGDNSKDEFVKSWKNSAEEAWKLIRYIVGDVSTPPLTPHLVKSSTSINEARRIINQLSQPLADISQLIFDNFRILDRREKELRQENTSLDQLKTKLYIPMINLKVINLTQPTTVCCDEKCAEFVPVEGITTWNYKQRCHDPCYLTNVPQDTIGAPQLKDCAAMNRATQTCLKCSCPQTVHMHIYYMTKKFNDTKIDDNVRFQINTHEKALAEAERIIKEIKKRKVELEEEKEIIVACAAKFAFFLQANAITPFNDAYRKYIHHMIVREKGLGQRADPQIIAHLEHLLIKYDEVKQAFDQVATLSSSLGRYSIEINAKDVTSELDKLYTLKHNGKKIKELYSCQKVSRKKEFEKTEYVHSSPISKPQNEPEEKPQKSDMEKTNKKIPKTHYNNQRKGYQQFVNKKFQQRTEDKINAPDSVTTAISTTGSNEQIKIEITKVGGSSNKPQHRENIGHKGPSRQQSNSGDAQNNRGGPNHSHHHDNHQGPRADNRASFGNNQQGYRNNTPYNQGQGYRPPNPSGFDNRAGYDNRPHYDNRPSFSNRYGYDNRPFPHQHPGYDNRQNYNNYPNHNNCSGCNRPGYDNHPSHPDHNNQYPQFNAPSNNYGPDYNRGYYDGRNPPHGYSNKYNPMFNNNRGPPGPPPPPYESAEENRHRNFQRDNNQPRNRSRPKYRNNGERCSSCNDSD